MEVTICVPSYGDDKWWELAHERAIPSAERQGVPVVHCHGADLMEARNDCLDKADTEWVIFLDADDTLEPGYVEAMTAAEGDVRAPSVRYRRANYDGSARMPRVAGHKHACSAECLPQGNWIVIGACARRSLLRELGGFRDFPWSEDWDLWLRCYLAGALILPAPEAIYTAWVRPDSRNRAPRQAEKLAAHRAIYEANFGAAA